MKEQLPRRRHTRSRDFDYTSAGPYFITVCADRMREIFGEIFDGRMFLSRIGELVQEAWHDIPRHRPGVIIDRSCVMPNHFHGILALPPGGVRLREDFGRPVKGSLGTVVRSFKSAVTRAAHDLLHWVDPVWQDGFHDRVIRNEKQLNDARTYIAENPARWETDRYHPSRVDPATANRGPTARIDAATASRGPTSG